FRPRNPLRLGGGGAATTLLPRARPGSPMRALLTCLAVLAAAASGCIQAGHPPSTSTAGLPAQAASLGGWQMDCGLGAFEQALNASWGQRCEARASHNPGPKEENWIAVNPTDPRNVVVGAKDLDP